MRKILSFIFWVFLCSVYGQKIPVMKKKATGQEHHFDIYSAFQNKMPKLIASQFVEDIEFVPLETTDECLLAESLRNITITEDDIILYDYNGCYRFDRQGKFKNRIGQKGNGPGEYVNSLSIMVDAANQWVYMMDYMQNKYVKYDFSGKYLGDISLDDYIGFDSNVLNPMTFLMENSLYQFAPQGERFSLKIVSEKYKRVISQMKCEYKGDIPKKLTCDPHVYNFKEDLYVNDYWCDTIYKVVNPFLLESYAVLDRGKFKYSSSYNDQNLMVDEKGRDVLSIFDLNETNRYFMLTSSQGNAVIDKRNGQTFVGEFNVKESCVEDDLYGGPGLRGSNLFSRIQGNEYYTFHYAHEFIENGNGKHRITDARYNAYRKMVGGLKADDNPVIMIVKLKK